jgi:hypothetical protein
MTNLDNLTSVIRTLASKENVSRYGGKTQIEVEAPKVDVGIFQDRPLIGWHSDVPNHLCVFSFSFDNDHCAAYVYVWEEDSRLRCTLVLSNIDSGHYEELPYISKSVDDHEIAERLIASLIPGTERMKASGAIEQSLAADAAIASTS